MESHNERGSDVVQLIYTRRGVNYRVWHHLGCSTFRPIQVSLNTMHEEIKKNSRRRYGKRRKALNENSEFGRLN